MNVDTDTSGYAYINVSPYSVLIAVGCNTPDTRLVMLKNGYGMDYIKFTRMDGITPYYGTFGVWCIVA